MELFYRKKMDGKTGKQRKSIAFLLTMSVLLLLCISCRSRDPMEPYRNLGAPKGFKRDSYEEMMHRKKADMGKKNKKSMLGDLFEKEQENRRKFRDVSRPMDRGTVQIFPWRGEENRSGKLHEQIRRENKRSDSLYY